jgi:hypothetical protein
MKKPPPRKELRRHVRRDIGTAGSVVLPDGRKIVCEIHDISETGARLLLKEAVELPMQFGLEIGRNVRRLCHRVRQDGTTAGVRFPQRG